jgi:very-short-patch-repair endonuclease
LALKSRKVAGAKFSRQIPIGPYFADFMCRALRLIVEIDGPSHDLTWEKDERRTAYLNAQGYRVIRFTNEEVRTNLDGVVAAIADALNSTPLALQAAPPTSGRGK